MARSVTHNIDSITAKLDLLPKKRHVPYAARTTTKRLGFQLSRKDIPTYMKGQFRKPVPFTTGSVFYNAISDYEVEISINRDKEVKKNDPKFISTQQSLGNRTRLTTYASRSSCTAAMLFLKPGAGSY